jgi:hypothetical protein
VDPGERRDDSESSESGEAEATNATNVNSEKKKDDSEKKKDKSDKKEKDSEKKEDDSEKKEDDSDKDEETVPVEFSIVLCDSSGMEYRARLADYQYLQPAIKPDVFKSRLFWEDAGSEVILQYVSLPLKNIKNSEGEALSAGAIRSICFVFDAEKKGAVIIDQLGFSR